MPKLKKTFISFVLNRLNDAFGKALLGTVKNKPILIDLLNAIFSDKPSCAVRDKITDVTFLDKELTPRHKDDKACRVDILCRTDSGTHINVELQTYLDRDLGVRVLSYASKIIAQILDRSIPYSEIRPTVIIVITNQDIRKALRLSPSETSDRRGHHIFGVYDSEDLSLRLTDKFELHFIQVQKYPTIMLKDMPRLG